MVQIFREERKKVHIYLLQNGVICFPKDTKSVNEVLEIENLKLFMICRSLYSKGCVTQMFNWQYHYYSLTNDGITYLKQELGIEDEGVKPITFRQRNDLEDAKKREPRTNKKAAPKEEKVEEIKAEPQVVNE